MLRQLFQQTTGSLNPSYLTQTQPGGAGAITTGTVTPPGISAPTVEPFVVEVFDVTAPTLLTAVSGATTAATPAVAGKLLTVDYNNSGPGGWRWKQPQALSKGIPYPEGQYGIVYKPANATAAGTGIATAGGNIANPGDKAEVVINGPINAYVQTSVGGFAISAGMPLQSDGAGNLTGINQGLPGVAPGAATGPPLAGQVLAYALGPVSSGISIPVLTPVYLGGY